MRLSLSSTSTRTFLLYPIAVALEQMLSRRPLRARWLPLLAGGYLQYRLAGEYRRRLGGGGPGMSNPPQRLVTSGIYACTRNPMYLGHLVFLTGVALSTRSPLAATIVAGSVPWFNARAAADEKQLEGRFGDAYRAYRDRVPRWTPRPSHLRTALKLWGASGTTFGWRARSSSHDPNRFRGSCG